VPETTPLSADALTCPLCGESVPVSAASCRGCHLPIADVRRHSARRSRSGSWVHAARVRLLGLALYTAVLVWCAWQLPTSLPFVGPAAAAGLVLHGVRGRPWLGLLGFVVVVVVLPVLLFPALGTGAFSDWGSWFEDPQWW
jgi:hypothetical protein